YALVLARFYDVPEQNVGYYIFPFALGNFLGPLLLGRLFDSVGRRKMIGATYAIAGLGLIGAGYGFSVDALSALQLSLRWSAIFFVVSAAASAAWIGVDAERKSLEEVCPPLGCDFVQPSSASSR